MGKTACTACSSCSSRRLVKVELLVERQQIFDDLLDILAIQLLFFCYGGIHARDGVRRRNIDVDPMPVSRLRRASGFTKIQYLLQSFVFTFCISIFRFSFFLFHDGDAFSFLYDSASYF